MRGLSVLCALLFGCPVSVVRDEASCEDAEHNGDESDVDCGGSCGPCGVGGACGGPEDCTEGVCEGGVCSEATCVDGVANGAETDQDCGGGCAGCAAGKVCVDAADCLSGVCTASTCQAPACSDGVSNGDESGVDCGGSCGPCADGAPCDGASDCTSGVCSGNVCQVPTCDDSVPNGDESDEDCGGSCKACADFAVCLAHSDCQSRVCSTSIGDTGVDTSAVDTSAPTGPGVCAPASCGDAVRNGEEPETDCGGGCIGCPDASACFVPLDCESKVCTGSVCQVPTCSDHTENGAESATDCGGPCDPCDDGARCFGDTDCISQVCDGDLCAVPTCEDEHDNGDETDVDCGGSCGPCSVGEGCAVGGDCVQGVCGDDDACAPAACDDETLNGNETDVDCGGGCDPCPLDALCGEHEDCASGTCIDDTCVEPTCEDELANGAESDVDCGGDCGPCTDGASCFAPVDCSSGVCDDTCQEAECGDEVENGSDLCDDGNDDESDACLSTCEPGPCSSDYPRTALVMNEILGSSSTIDANCDGVTALTQDAFVEIVNVGDDDVDLKDFTLSDSDATRYTFGSKVLRPGKTVVVFGGGAPRFDGTATTGDPWCVDLPSSVTVLTAGGDLGLPGGDTLTLADSFGNHVDSLAVPASTDVVLVRAIEEAMSATVAATAPTPGQRASGTDFGVPTLVVNEVLADVPTDSEEGDANCDGIRDSGKDEFVEVVNFGSFSLDLSGMSIEDGDEVRHVFADGTTLAAGEAIVVFGGGSPVFDGTSANPSPHCQAEVRWVRASTGALSLTNSEDSVTLRDADLEAVDAVEWLSEVADASVQRVPETSREGTAVAGPISPGTRADGGPMVTVLINEVLAVPDNGDVNCDGVLNANQDRFVEIVNPNGEPFDLSGAVLTLESGPAHAFAANTVLDPGDAVLVFGGGSPQFDAAGAEEWCVDLPNSVEVQVASSGGLSFNADDSVVLSLPSGEVLDIFSWESELTGESWQRSPQIEDGALVSHSSLDGTTFSPGTRADGSALFRGTGGTFSDATAHCEE